jgi:hypothetical protein
MGASLPGLEQGVALAAGVTASPSRSAPTGSAPPLDDGEPGANYTRMDACAAINGSVPR